MTAKTLSQRIVVMSVIWIVLALISTALVLAWLYRQHIQEHFDAHVFSHVEELVAAMETDENGRHYLVREPTDPRFFRPGSGWYWAVLDGDKPVEQSASLGEGRLRIMDPGINESHGVRKALGPNGDHLRAHVMHVSYPHDPGVLTFVATVPEMSITDDVRDFLWHILLSFLALGVLLALAVRMQVNLALKPLRQVQSSLADVKTGQLKRLPSDFPSDMQPLVDELNHLIDHNETLLKRARNQLADLAHAVKNPLAVIRNEARKMHTPEGQLILEQAQTTAHSIDHCLTRARIFGNQEAMGYRSSVKAAIDDLSYAMEQIHKDRDIEICFECLGEQWFRGEGQDLEEMIGNLLDNACKWARQRVVLGCTAQDGRLELTIEDDGPGIPEDQVEDVMQRGHKLDETRPGHGHGLSIVKDIAELYGGSLTLSESALGGLKATLQLPAATTTGID